MNAIGELVMWAGFGIAVLGIAGMLVGIVVQLTGLVRGDSVDHRGSELFFRFGRLPMLGLSIATVGLVMSGRLPWPFLLGAALFAVPAVFLLTARLDFSRRRR